MNFHIHAICHNILQTNKNLRKRSEKYKDNNKKNHKKEITSIIVNDRKNFSHSFIYIFFFKLIK